jgi:hypothetical protein
MHHRFCDEWGVAWEAWDVLPTSAERRQADRRVRGALASIRQLPLGSAERRRGGDRRTHAEPRAPISGEFAAGWVVFQSATERRRLAPIPERWESCAERDLRVLCARAASASKPRRLIE